MTNKEDKTDKPIFKHDKLLKVVMDYPIVRNEFLKMHLPADIQSSIDFDTLKLEKESFVTKELRNSIADILFSVKIANQDGFLIILLEHQSKPDHFMALRLFQYMLRICEKYLKENSSSKTLPLIYPVLLYNGRQRYNASRNLWNLFSNPDLAKNFWANNDYQLIDLHSIDDEELKKHIWAGTLQLFMKHIYDRKLLNVWEAIKNTLPKLAQIEIGYDFIKLLLVYTLTKMEDNDKISIENLLNTTLGEEQGEDIMASIAQKWYDDGMTKGKAEGKAEGVTKGMEQKAIEIATNMLKQDLSIQLITQVTGLSVEQVKKLKYSL